ncbi:MAG: hypothetical protein EGP08_04010 [SAR202 cluster bacterium]|nr:MAG: hypothetical protein EGP08_04010 [SAR202 cluster bacterium]MCH2319255.1 hypothetical protein [SAR202 cluster bacterium]MQF68071.1 hypothetical protein [SAR202 cluster bacterium AD-802-K11_MRT_200m]MQG74998.1 hypothetical protein [SAR202 cluster bacterium]
MPDNIGDNEPQFDKEKYAASLTRLDSIFRNISKSVTEISKSRCPYKNVQDRCTAKFGCRNQNIKVPPGEMYICVGSDDLDYRDAWESETPIV